MPSKLSIVVSNHTARTLSLFNPANYSITEGAILSPPGTVVANRDGAGGVFTFDSKLCAISVYENPDPKYVWILFVQATKEDDPIVKTAFYPAATRINPALVNHIKNSSAFGNTATRSVSVGRMTRTYQATCRVRAAEDTKPGEGRTVEFKLTATGMDTAENLSRSSSPALVDERENHSVGFKRASTATLANGSRFKHGAAMPSKLSIAVSNHTPRTLSLFNLVQYSIVEGAISSPPGAVEAHQKGVGGKFTFDTNLCALSVYESPDPKYVWILFVQASKGDEPIVKTAFYPAATRINSALVNHIKDSSAFGNTAIHNVSAGPTTRQPSLKATCRVWAPEDTEPDEGLTVEFKLIDIAVGGSPTFPESLASKSKNPSVALKPALRDSFAGGFHGAVLSSKLSIIVSNHTATTLSLFNPVQYSIVDGAISFPPQAIEAKRKGAGGIFTFDTELCAISVYESPDPKHVWILFVQASKGRAPLVKTVFYPVTTRINSALVNTIRNNPVFGNAAEHNVSIGQITYKATCRILAAEETEPEQGLIVGFKLTVAALVTSGNPSKTTLRPSSVVSELDPDDSSSIILARAPTATVASETCGAARSPKLRIIISNHTATILHLFNPVRYSVVDGTISSPPQAVEAKGTGAGGVFTFDTELCAISVYESPDLGNVWILFVQASKGRDAVVKTGFFPTTTRINSSLVNTIRSNPVFGNTAEHSDSVGQITYQATCRILATDETEPEQGLIVEFKLTVAALVTAGNPHKNPSCSPTLVSEPDSDDSSVMSARAPTATLARETNLAVTPSKLSITVFNKTAQILHPASPREFATSEGVNSTPPRSVAADSKDAGGVYTFHTDLCAISVYESPNPDFVWILFVQSSIWEDPIVKTVFFPAKTAITEVLANDIKNSAAYEHMATHAFTTAGLNVILEAKCWAAGCLSVGFELSATVKHPTSVSPIIPLDTSRSPSPFMGPRFMPAFGPPPWAPPSTYPSNGSLAPPMPQAYAYDEGGFGYGRNQSNRAARGDARQRDRDAFREHARRAA